VLVVQWTMATPDNVHYIQQQQQLIHQTLSFIYCIHQLSINTSVQDTMLPLSALLLCSIHHSDANAIAALLQMTCDYLHFLTNIKSYDTNH